MGTCIHDRLAADVTCISNLFLDKYMASANGDYIKVYLYLLRHGEEAFSDGAAADALNLTDNDIRRAIRYWEKMGVVSSNGKDAGDDRDSGALPGTSKERISSASASLCQNSEWQKPTLIEERISPASGSLCQNSEWQKPTLIEERKTLAAGDPYGCDSAAVPGPSTPSYSGPGSMPIFGKEDGSHREPMVLSMPEFTYEGGRQEVLPGMDREDASGEDEAVVPKGFQLINADGNTGLPAQPRPEYGRNGGLMLKTLPSETVKKAVCRTGAACAQNSGVLRDCRGGSMNAVPVHSEPEDGGEAYGYDTAPAEPRTPAAEDGARMTGTMDSLENDEEFAGILFVAKHVLPVLPTQRHVETLGYMYQELKMESDLIEFLLEYCAGIGKTSSRYMETVAIDWHEQGIKTVHQAQDFIREMEGRKSGRRAVKKKGRAATAPSTNKFLNFTAVDVDYDSIARKKVLDRIENGIA